MVARGRRQGFAFLDGPVVPGTAAVGAAFPAQAPLAALSVAAISARMGPARQLSLRIGFSNGLVGLVACQPMAVRKV